MDHINAKRKRYNYSIPHASFNAALYRQPSLNEEEQQPEPYRTVAASLSQQQAVASRRNSLKTEARDLEKGQGHVSPTVGGRPTTIPEADIEEEDHKDLEDDIEEVLGDR